MPRPFTQDGRRISYLDGLKGIAILMVVASHTLDHTLRVPPGSATPRFFHYVVAGHHGVQLFSSSAH